MTSVGVVVPTFGDLTEWEPKVKRALDSVFAQTVQPRNVHWAHDESLAACRNRGLEYINTEWVIFLDADDELDPRYIEKMLEGDGDIRQPSTLGVVAGVEDDAPVLIPKKDLSESNYLIIGCMCRTERAIAVGGFEDLECLEDWDFWIRMVLDGQKVSQVPEAIYRVHVNPNGRNQNPVWPSVYSKIKQKYANQRELLR